MIWRPQTGFLRYANHYAVTHSLLPSQCLHLCLDYKDCSQPVLTLALVCPYPWWVSVRSFCPNLTFLGCLSTDHLTLVSSSNVTHEVTLAGNSLSTSFTLVESEFLAPCELLICFPRFQVCTCCTLKNLKLGTLPYTFLPFGLPGHCCSLTALLCPRIGLADWFPLTSCSFIARKPVFTFVLEV